jgi:hypothetical protein
MALLAHPSTDLSISEHLQPPAGHREVIPVATIGVVQVEDRFDGFRGFGEPR